MHVYRNCHGT